MLPVLVVLVGSWFAAWWLLTQRLDERIDTELTGEVSELRLLAGDGVDPRTGSAFADVADLLELHIDRSIPDPNETMFVIVDGQVDVAQQPIVPRCGWISMTSSWQRPREPSTR